MVPEGSFVFARATINIAVGVMQIVGYGLGGLLLLAFAVWWWRSRQHKPD